MVARAMAPMLQSMPMNDPISAQYQGESGRAYHVGKRSIPPQAVPWVERLRAEKFAPYVLPGDTVFEFGAGFGWNLARLSCRRRLAYDICGHLEKGLREQGFEYVADLASVPDQTAHAVICHHVLEHVPSPAETLAAIKRILRPNGSLLLFVPFECELRYRRYDPKEPNHHLYSWNVQSLGNLAAASGFVIQESRLGAYGYDRFCAKMACRFRLGESGFRLLRRVSNTILPVMEIKLIAKNSGLG